MKLLSDTLELAQAEVMKRVFEPVQDDIPDPGINFEDCVSAISEKVQRQVAAVAPVDRPAWFIERALALHGWCERIKAPDALVQRISAWLRRLLRELPAGRA